MYRPILLVCLSILSIGPLSKCEGQYDPLEIKGETFKSLDDTVHDATRNSDIPIRLYLPIERVPNENNKGAEQGRVAHPVILFSHGLGGSRDAGKYLGEHWASRGYIGVFMQHPGSDTSAWRDEPVGQKMAKLKEAANAKNFLSRVQDVKGTLDQLETWNKDSSHPLYRKMDLERIGMSGHSFGAVTTQAVSGQSYPMVGTRYTDPRIKAALPFSPSLPKRQNASGVFEKVSIPWMLMTGTKDESPIEKIDPASRAQVFEALPKTNDRYLLVLHDATHGAFANSVGKSSSNEGYHRSILALSTAYWDAYLRQDSKAMEWLHSSQARTVLKSDDRWEASRKSP